MNVLVGANNAGKSTILAALKLLASMLPLARRINPKDVGQYQGASVRGWRVTAAALETAGFSAENIRHDFRPTESRIELRLTSGARMAVVWGTVDTEYDESAAGTFFVFPPQDSKLTPRLTAQTLVPDIGVVPSITPLDDHEAYVVDETVKRNSSSRRASRYFRNTLNRLEPSDWESLTTFIYSRTPEIGALELRRSIGDDVDEFDLFFSEPRSRHEREIAWAGDGLQIWLQDLYHVWRLRDKDVLLLDEPDVFLHPDLQRRLARTLFESSQQLVLATHSSEVLAEAPPASAVWIDRQRRRSERPRMDGALGLMGRRLGSAFELGVGRAFRSRVVLFVEGDDTAILSAAAHALKFPRVASSDDYATVPLGGFSRNSIAGAFSESIEAIGADVETFVVLDSDLRSEAELLHESTEVRKHVKEVHIWERRELENYLLDAGAVAGVTGLPFKDAEERLERAIWAGRDEARLEFQAVRVRDAGRLGIATKTAIRSAEAEFDALWLEAGGRLSVVDAKEAIHHLNRELQADKKKTVNAVKLAQNLDRSSASEEFVKVLAALESILDRV